MDGQACHTRVFAKETPADAEPRSVIRPVAEPQAAT